MITHRSKRAHESANPTRSSIPISIATNIINISIIIVKTVCVLCDCYHHNLKEREHTVDFPVPVHFNVPAFTSPVTAPLLGGCGMTVVAVIYHLASQVKLKSSFKTPD